MILLTHITIALASLAWATYVYFAPTAPKLRASYVLAALTLGTGTYLIFSTGSHILQACLSGLTYFAVVMALSVSTQAKLSATDK